MPDLAGRRVQLRLFQTGPSFFLSLFFQSCISVYVLPFWHVSLLPSRSPFCSSSQNETRNLERKKKKEQNVCRAIVWSRIGRELDGTALMASKRPKPKPPWKLEEGTTTSITGAHKSGKKAPAEASNRSTAVSRWLLQSKAPFSLPPFFRLSLPKRQQRFFALGDGREKEEGELSISGGGGAEMLRCRTTKELVTCLVGGGKKKKGERDYATDEKEKEEAVHIGRRRGGMGFEGTNQRFGFSAAADRNPFSKKSLQRTNRRRNPSRAKKSGKRGGGAA